MRARIRSFLGVSEGNIRELLSLSVPLMITASSGSFMLFAARLVLSRCYPETVSATVVATTLYMIFIFGMMGITSVTEVFVGRYNGACHYHRMGEPVWQMIWFTLASFLVFIPCGLFLGPFIIPAPLQADGVPYFRMLMLLGPFHAMVPAIGSFFIGQGKLKLVVAASIISNIFNLLGNWTLVYGFFNYIPTLGAQGSAIATALANVLNNLILFVAFIAKPNRLQYGTGNLKFVPKALKECLQIGLANTFSHGLEVIGWSCILMLATCVGENVTRVFNIWQSVFLLFAFVSDGLQKGVIASAANLLGAKKYDLLSRVFVSSINLSIGFSLLLSIPFIFYAHPLISFFLGNALENETELMQAAVVALRWLWVFCTFDMITWAVSGILTAAGDTRALMVMNVVSIWGFAVLPIYLYVVKGGGPWAAIWIFSAMYAVLNASLVCVRYYSKRWRYFEVPVVEASLETYAAA